MTYKSKELIAVCCHDAGGANIISSWLEINKINFLPVLRGPAKDIFKNKFPTKNNVSINYALDRCDWVLTGSSILAIIENKITILAKKKKYQNMYFSRSLDKL